MPKEALSKKADSVIDLMFIKGKATAVINGPIALKSIQNQKLTLELLLFQN